MPICVTISALFTTKAMLGVNPLGRPFSSSCNSHLLHCLSLSDCLSAVSDVVVLKSNEATLKRIVDVASSGTVRELVARRRFGTFDILDWLLPMM